MPNATPGLSLLVPVFNEQDSLVTLHEQIAAVAKQRELDVEIIFVDDGSRDGSWNKVKELAARDARVRGLRFRRNFGKAAALLAAFREVRGDRAVMLDADLQDDPAEIPNFLAELDKGLDVVCGWKKVRHDPWHKVLPSRVFNWMVSSLTKVKLHDHNCGMKAFNAPVVRELYLYGEMHRFIAVLAAGRGFKVGELVIQHRPRQFGQSKYGFNRFLRGFLDLLTVRFLTVHGRRPMHLFGGWALTLFVIMAAVALIGVFGSPVFSGLTLIGIVLGVLLPLIFLLNGLQAELIISSRRDEPYCIVDRIG